MTDRKLTPHPVRVEFKLTWNPVQKLNHEIDVQKNYIRRIEADISVVEGNINLYTKEIEETHLKLDKMVVRKDLIRRMMTEKTEEIAGYRLQVLTDKNRKSETEVTIQKLEQELKSEGVDADKINHNIDMNKNQVSRIDSEISLIESNIKLLETELREYDVKLEKLIHEEDMMMKLMTERELTMEGLRKYIDERRGTIRDVEMKIRQLEENKKAPEEELIKMNEEADRQAAANR